MLSDVVYVARHGGGKQAYLNLLRHKLEYIINLVFETAREHLVRLVENEHLDVAGAECTPIDHVIYAAGGANNNVDAFLQLANIVPNIGTSDARVALGLHEVSELDDNLLNLLGQFAGRCKEKRLAGAILDIDALQYTDSKGGCLACSTLRLANGVTSPDQRKDTFLLDSRRLFETVGINAAEKIFVELERIEGLNCFRPVALNVGLVKGGIKSFGHFGSLKLGFVCCFV